MSFDDIQRAQIIYKEYLEKLKQRVTNRISKSGKQVPQNIGPGHFQQEDRSYVWSEMLADPNLSKEKKTMIEWLQKRKEKNITSVWSKHDYESFFNDFRTCILIGECKMVKNKDNGIIISKGDLKVQLHFCRNPKRENCSSPGEPSSIYPICVPGLRNIKISFTHGVEVEKIETCNSK